MFNSIMYNMQEMDFISVDDFFVKKKKIKQRYEYLTFDEKEIYKWYFFYQLTLCKYKTKDKISVKEAFWDYLNDNVTSNLINKVYLEYCNSRDKD